MQDTNNKELNTSIFSLSISNSAIQNTELENQSKIISVFIFIPNTKVFRIKLKLNSYLTILNNLFDSDSIYIYNGKILDNNKKFSYYNVQDEDLFVLLSPKLIKSDNNALEKWLKITNDNETLINKIKIRANFSYQKEIARNRDIKSVKNEMKPKQFGRSKENSYKHFPRPKFFNKFNNSDNIESSLNIDYKIQEEPSCDPLPIIW